MGRQSHSRQTRRAAARRGQQLGKGQKNSGRARWSLFAGIAVVLVAVAIFAYSALGSRNTTSAAGQPTPDATFPAGPTIGGIGCDQGMPAGGVHTHAHLTILSH